MLYLSDCVPLHLVFLPLFIFVCFSGGCCGAGLLIHQQKPGQLLFLVEKTVGPQSGSVVYGGFVDKASFYWTSCSTEGGLLSPITCNSVWHLFISVKNETHCFLINLLHFGQCSALDGSDWRWQFVTQAC